MNQERDSFLYEAMGECLHERDFTYKNPWYEFPKCKKCGRQVANIGHQPTFDTYEGLGKLIKYAEKSGIMKKIKLHMTFAEFVDLMTDPNKAADRLYQYLKGKK